MNTIRIGRRAIGQRNPVFIIAEAGVNHNGSVRRALKMIDAATACGADAIKFQTFNTDDLVTPAAPTAAYQKKNTRQTSQHALLKSLELSEGDFRVIQRHCARRKILFLSTPFDTLSAALLNRMGVPAFKISSGEITNIPLLRQIGRYGKPVILSTGMSEMDDVRTAVKTIRAAGNDRIILLHCTSNYPAPVEEVHLRAMQTLGKAFKCPVGFSDHTRGIAAALAAVALGACVIEKHFTLDTRLPGPDHASSLTPEQFGELVMSVRVVELALGGETKSVQPSERAVMRVARKSIVAACDIPAGAVITERMLSLKRPGTGMAPKLMPLVIGRTTRRSVRKDEFLAREMVK